MKSTLSGEAKTRFVIYSTKLPSTAFAGDFSSSAPASPFAPWIYGALKFLRQIGRSEPATTGISCFFISKRMFRAFVVVFYKVVFPSQVLTPSKWLSLWLAPKIIAIMSSWPGSQSIHNTFFDILLLTNNAINCFLYLSYKINKMKCLVW